MELRNIAVAVAIALLVVGCGCAPVPPPTPAPTSRAFDLTLRVEGSPNATATQTVRAAEQRLESFITADLPDVPNTKGLRCAGRALNSPSKVDDLFVAVRFVDIDGPKGVLAGAGPCQVRGGSRLPITGLIEIDLADVGPLIKAGQLDETILHEMTHVLGFGSIWTDKGLLRNPKTSSVQFTGAKANAAWRTLGGVGPVPVEDRGDSGTRDGHWRERSMGNELMTGYVNNGANPFSSVSVASLGDLGYSVNVARADAYTPPRTGRDVGPGHRGGSPAGGRERLITPG